MSVLKLCIAGHTNTGKTSLIRTLARDASFGEVSDEAGTTRSVAVRQLLVGGQTAIELHDTPGLEDSLSLLEHLDAGPGVDGPAGIEVFLSSPEAEDRFSQEATALRQVLRCDAALYVIDARDPVLAKHRDELTILGRCARPIIPILNFVALESARTAAWRDALARVNMHAVAEFDTMVLEDDGERRLFEKLGSLLDRHRDTLEALTAELAEHRRRLVQASRRLVADMLVDAAALVTPVESSELAEASLERLRETIRSREQQCVLALLELHRFHPDDCDPGVLPLENGQWGLDLFNPAALQRYGIRSGGGAAAGALAGLSVDVLMHGATLGAGAAIGAVFGAVAGTGADPARRMLRRARGGTEVRCPPETLRLLATRQLDLIRSLLHRGHASQEPIRLHDAREVRRGLDEVVVLLRQASVHPDWWRPGRVSVDPARDALVEKVAGAVGACDV